MRTNNSLVSRYAEDRAKESSLFVQPRSKQQRTQELCQLFDDTIPVSSKANSMKSQAEFRVDVKSLIAKFDSKKTNSAPSSVRTHDRVLHSTSLHHSANELVQAQKWQRASPTYQLTKLSYGKANTTSKYSTTLSVSPNLVSPSKSPTRFAKAPEEQRCTICKEHVDVNKFAVISGEYYCRLHFKITYRL